MVHFRHRQEMNKPTARIDDWIRYGNALIGKISKHPRQPQFKTTQITSCLVSFDPENNRAETLNTIYELGAPYVQAPNR